MGTSRNSRPLPALQAGWLAVDSRGPRALLAQLAPTAGCFNFFDSTNTRHGAWDAFFDEIPLVRYAMLAEAHPGRLGDFLRVALPKFDGRIDLAREDAVLAAWTIIDRLVTVHRRVDAEERVFARWPEEAAFAAVLRQAITDVLRHDYRTICAGARWLADQGRAPPFPLGRPDDRRAPRVAAGLSPELWSVDEGDEPPDDRTDPTTNEAERFVRELTRAAWRTQSTFAELVAGAGRNFQVRYASPAGLPPHFALYLAFLQQFAHAQQALNQVPERHRDFFYRDVLKLRPAPAIPDTTFVSCTAAPGAWLELPVGTPLLAGQDSEGRPVIYRTIAPTSVTPSALAQVAAVWLAPAWTHHSSGFQFDVRAVAPDGTLAPAPAGGGWAMFGETPPAAPALRTMADAQIGFALSSPVLHLEEGTRTITLELIFAAPAAETAEPVTQTLTSVLWQIDYSTAGAWAPVRQPVVATLSYVAGDPPVVRRLVIVLTLQAGDPPCVNYDAKALGPGYDARTPVLRVRFPNPRAIFQEMQSPPAGVMATAFAGATLSQLTVRVKAEGLSDLSLAGPSGKLAAGKPMPVFGSPPVAGGVFVLGKAELFRKQLASLDVQIDWQGLPIDPHGAPPQFPNGLADYYREYSVAFDPLPPTDLFANHRYAVYLSALQQRTWKRIDILPAALGAPAGTLPDVVGQPVNYLFAWNDPKGEPVAPPRRPPPPRSPPPASPDPSRKAPPSGPLAAQRTWSADTRALASLRPEPGLAGPSDYSPAAASGFIGVQLCAPEYLFGQAIYPNAVSRVALDNAVKIVNAAKSVPPITQNRFSPTEACELLKGDPVTPAPESALVKQAAGKVLSAGARLLGLGLVRSLGKAVLGGVLGAASLFKGKSAQKKADAPAPAPRLWKLNAALFPALAAAGSPPAGVAAALAAAGVTAPDAFAKLRTLSDATFSDQASFEAIFVKALALTPENWAICREDLLSWLAWLVAPKLSNPPRPPLVPMAAAVRVSYTADVTLSFPPPAASSPGPDAASPPAASPGWDTLWRISPFGATAMLSAEAPLLPWVEEGGCFYLGFRDIAPPETLALLFSLRAEPATTGDASEPDQPVWAYLARDDWKEPPDQAFVHDETRGFLRTGIVRLKVPDDADTGHTVMPAGLVWFRARVKSPAVRLRAERILGHAVEVAWSPPDDVTDASIAAHFAAPLPAGSISGLQVPQPAVVKIVQPLPATGGAPPEDREDFATRVSERLRHKDRAVTALDYEKLLLRRYPGVFFARAVTPQSVTDGGEVVVVVLPTLTTAPVAPPPGFVAGDLIDMAAYLGARAPLSAAIRVVNPTYERIQLKIQATFSSDLSLAQYRARLTDDLKDFISPWMYRQSEVKDPVTTFHASDFTAFVRGRPYVRNVATCEVYRDPYHEGVSLPESWIAPRSGALLLSAATHLINEAT